MREQAAEKSRRAESGGGSSWQNLDGGLGGIAIDLPALNVKPTHGEYIPMNIQKGYTDTAMTGDRC